jgi:two-component system, chemotaxis family, CheB/CheR fusion protein
MAYSEGLFQLIVIGSSAGGIEALTKLVASLPSPFPVPIVVAQHLDPNRPSHLADILNRHSALPAVVVEQQELLQPGMIYVVPSNNHIAITQHDVSILPYSQERPKPSVDLLLSTAAEIYGEKLIAIILTGTGSDGKLGAHSVHENGGTVIIQNPATAAYPGMPQSLDPQTVDMVADLEQIGTILSNLLSGQLISNQLLPELELETFLVQVLDHTGLDFRNYKSPTILRRLQRRLIATDSADLDKYKLYLHNHPQEYEQLVNSFLLKVTNFMRDPELFDLLQIQILPGLVEYARKHQNQLRCWSAGCATGEEAYSLAILLCEVLGDKLAHFNIKIFATDLDTAALTFARRGFYPSAALSQLPPAIVERYFTPVNDGYEIKKLVRDLLVFGEHDLAQRAPFPHIDLVLCRNVLIYFSRELQRHVLQLFAFALRDAGYLVLGRTETTNPLAEFFAPIEAPHRIYRRQGSRRLAQPLHVRAVKPNLLPVPAPAPSPAGSARTVQLTVRASPPIELSSNRAARENLLHKLPIGVVVVDQHFDIQEINSAARRLLSIHTAAIGEDFVHLTQYVSPRELAAAITKALRNNQVSSLEEVQVPQLATGKASFLQLTCYPHPAPVEVERGSENTEANSPRYVLILVTDVTLTVESQRAIEQANSTQAKAVAELAQSIETLQITNSQLSQSNVQLEQLNRALAEAKTHNEAVADRHARQMELLIEANQSLLEANQRLSAENVDLRSSNEDYMLHDEEAQAAIEEAETLNEELQATNEELETLNEELQASLEELNSSNSELALQAIELKQQHERSERAKIQLNAILNAMSDALLVVSPTGEVLLTNPAYRRVFQASETLVLLDESGEKPLGVEELPQARLARGETFKMRFSFSLADGNRQWWEAVGQPVELNDATSWGLVVLRDITELSLRQSHEQFVAMVTHELRTPLTTIRGNTELVESKLSRNRNPVGGSESLLQSLRNALSQIERLERLITDLGDVQRLQNGKFKFAFEQVRLDSLVAQMVEVGQHLTNEQTIELVGENVPLTVIGDPERLQQVILNLINNAIRHASSSPRISLSLAQVGERVELRVQDYGPGIKASHLPNLFSRFYQVSHGKAEAGAGAGLGLGLFISQQIVMAHAGTISVESTEEIGTTFIVSLPLDPLFTLLANSPEVIVTNAETLAD